jgi:glutamyl-tRNA reductase
MNGVVMVGLCHRTAPLPLLESVAVTADRRAAVLDAARAAGFSEAVLLATCSRIEIYAAGQGDPQRLIHVLAGAAGDSSTDVRRALVLRADQDAVTHLFRVTAGLESRVVGEPDVRIQVRAALRDACATSAVGGVLGELFAAAVRTAGLVHRETTLGSTSRSLASCGVELGLMMAGVARPSVLVVGSGRMAGVAVHQLRLLGHRPVVVARDASRAMQVAGASYAHPLSELGARMAAADVVICATSASEPLVTTDHVQRAMSDRRAPLTLVDLSMPRNIDPAVSRVDGVHVVNLEAMREHSGAQSPVAQTLIEADGLLRGAVQRYLDHVAARRAGPLIAAMRARVESRCVEVVQAAAPSSSSDEENVRLARTIAGRLVHPATMAARAAAAAGDDATLLTICEAFDVTLTPETVGLATADLRSPVRAPSRCT